MRLFTAKEIDTVEKEKTTKRISEGFKLSKAVERERNKLNELVGERKRLENEQKEEIIRLQMGHEQKKSALLGEISSLEQRRADLLKPVDEIIERAELRELEAVDKNIWLDNEKEKVASALKRAKEAESKVIERVGEANLLLANAKKVQAMTKAGLADLKEREAGFDLAVKGAEEDIKKRMGVVKQREEGVAIKEAVVLEKEEFLKRKEAMLNEQTLKIKSERSSLEAASKEIYGSSSQR